jgi:uncharacterized membrane protein
MKSFKYKRFYQNFYGVIVLIFLSGCQSIPTDLGGDAGPLFRRGVVSLENDELNFQACYVNKNEKINDHTGKLRKRFKRTEAPVFYAELSGDHISLGEAWQVYKVHLLGGNQFTCGYELKGNEFRAAGNDPLWIADLREDGIFVQNYGRMSQLIFPREKPINLGNGYEWYSTTKGIETNELTLRLMEQHCVDQFGIEYEYISEMTLNSKVYKGCGRRGDLEIRTLPGLYSALLPGIHSLGRFITLDVTSDNTVLLTQDYRNRQPLILQKGTWERLGSGKIVIHLTDIDGRKENEVLIFQRDKRGALVLKGYSTTYGSSGLRLERVGPERVHRRFNR